MRLSHLVSFHYTIQPSSNSLPRSLKCVNLSLVICCHICIIITLFHRPLLVFRCKSWNSLLIVSLFYELILPCLCHLHLYLFIVIRDNHFVTETTLPMVSYLAMHYHNIAWLTSLLLSMCYSVSFLLFFLLAFSSFLFLQLPVSLFYCNFMYPPILLFSCSFVVLQLPVSRN